MTSTIAAIRNRPLTAWAQALIEQAGSYVEITPSAAGLRIVGIAQTGAQHFMIRRGRTARRSRFMRRRQPLHYGHRGCPADRPLADITPVVHALIAEHAGAQAGARTAGPRRRS